MHLFMDEACEAAVTAVPGLAGQPSSFLHVMSGPRLEDGSHPVCDSRIRGAEWALGQPGGRLFIDKPI